MRLKGITIEGFRAFPAEIAIDLDADAVIVLGANGQGKTSLLDAILWALTGRIERLGTDPANVLSEFSDSGIARVALDLNTVDDGSLHVSRVFDGKNPRVVFESNDNRDQGQAAETRILSALWRDALVAPDPTTAFSAAFCRSVYLEQDRVRDFLDADDAQARFGAVSELFGAGRVTELQRQLENDKKQWTTASNRLRKDLDAKEHELASYQEDLDRIGSDRLGSTANEIESQLRAWWSRLERHDLPITRHHETVEHSRASSTIDAALREIDETRLQVGRQVDEAISVLEDLSTPPADDLPDLDLLKARVSRIENEVASNQELLAAAIYQAKKHRQTQLQLQEARSELALLAEMALRHLGDRCPVCQQTYDRDTTTTHLRKLTTQGEDSEQLDQHLSDDVAELRKRISNLEVKADSSRAAVERAITQQRARLAWQERLAERLVRLGLKPEQELDSLAEVLSATIRSLRARASDLSSLREQGESLALLTARLYESTRYIELAEQLELLTAEHRELKDQLVWRDRTGDTAKTIISALRNANERVVESQLGHIQPLLERVYARIDPHVELRSVDFLTKYSGGHGQLRARLKDFAEEHLIDSPETILSSSQLNALAVSIFLSFNLGLTSLPLHVTMLDDPLQSLDDVNLLGLVDTLRRTLDRRQLIVSTHDRRFGQLLERKLRPIGETQRTVVIELEGWDRHGPIVTQRDVARDSKSLRVVA